jgi:hypothetical protein
MDYIIRFDPATDFTDSPKTLKNKNTQIIEKERKNRGIGRGEKKKDQKTEKSVFYSTHVTPAGACRSQKEFYTLNSKQHRSGKRHRIMFPRKRERMRHPLLFSYRPPLYPPPLFFLLLNLSKPSESHIKKKQNKSKKRFTIIQR